jgi:hypothetical protein
VTTVDLILNVIAWIVESAIPTFAVLGHYGLHGAHILA